MYRLLKTIYKSGKKILLAPFILHDYLRFIHTKRDKRFATSLQNLYPQIFDKTLKTGFDRHYVYFTAWAARILAETKPQRHVDISSSLYFTGITSAFVPIDFYDYRPADLKLENVTSKEGDLLQLPFEDASVPSLSSMHVVEHIGLGRYGDPIDPEGDIKAAKELLRVLANEGNLLFVTPVGKKPIIEFNAHRIYTYEQVLAFFPTLTLKEFALIPEDGSRGGLIRNANPNLLAHEHYACGCFWFTKKASV